MDACPGEERHAAFDLGLLRIEKTLNEGADQAQQGLLLWRVSSPAEKLSNFDAGHVPA
jgi:hypothetical protein